MSKNIPFPRVQQQPNFKDCAIYAMAFATSIFFHDDPEKITYDIRDDSMRKHFIQIWDKKKLIRFPTINKTGISVKWTFRMRTNVDGVSCYANSVVQSTFHCLPDRNSLFESLEYDTLKTVFYQFMNKDTFVNIITLRSFANSMFLTRCQQDVAEFLQFLWQKSKLLESIISIQKTISTICERCDVTKTVDSNLYHVWKLYVPFNKIHHTVQSIIDDNCFALGIQLFCDVCESELKDILSINVENEVAILQLDIFDLLMDNDLPITIKNTEYELKDLINDIIKINNKNFSSVIFHSG